MRLTDEQILGEIEYFKMLKPCPITNKLGKYLDTIEALQQENEQLQAQVAQYREAVEVLETVTEHLENCYGRNTPDTEKAREVLAAIDALGGKEDYPCTDHDCYDKGNYHTGCESCPKYKKVTGGKEDA